MKKKNGLVMVLVLILAATAAARAEAGVKLFLGYSVGQTENKLNEEGAYAWEWSHSGIEHGPSLDVRYEGDAAPVFVRATFDYNILPDIKEEDADPDPLYYEGHDWSTELNIGYRVYKRGSFAITPYGGIGYLDWKLTGKTNSQLTETYRTPYAAAGAIFGYAEPGWSVALDVAFLLPFAGKYSYTTTVHNNSFDEPVGMGARIQLPVTFSIIPKKDRAFGLMVFATPFYKFIAAGKSDNFNEAGGSGLIDKMEKNTFSTFGIKAGVGLEF
ncbi:MAG: outer membrane beta-barrel protein [Deltaproteobacteria bacterium]